MLTQAEIEVLGMVALVMMLAGLAGIGAGLPGAIRDARRWLRKRRRRRALEMWVLEELYRAAQTGGADDAN